MGSLKKEQEQLKDDLTEVLWVKKFQEFFCNDWSVAGVKYVFMSGALWTRRLAWMILVLFGSGFMLYQISDRVIYYATNPTALAIKVNYKSELEFPTVTVCNENIVHKQRADTIAGLSEIISSMYPAWFTEQKPNLTRAQEIIHFMEVSNISWEFVWEFLSPFYQKQNIIMCNFMNVACGENDIKVISTSYGYCLQFNGADSNITTTQSGQYFGLHMILNISQDNYLMSQSRGAGVRIQLHTKSEDPYPDRRGYQVQHGVINNAAVKTKEVTQLPAPYNEDDCNDDVGYNYERCKSTCFHEYVIKGCGCRFQSYRNSPARVCDLLDLYTCADPLANSIVRGQEANHTCTKCIPQCHNTYYQYTLSSSSISNLALDTITNSMCEIEQGVTNSSTPCNGTELGPYREDILKNLVELRIFYDELSVEKVQSTKSYSILALLCDIGGALGLILGSTLLTVFEILDLSIVVLYDCINFAIAKRKQVNQK